MSRVFTILVACWLTASAALADENAVEVRALAGATPPKASIEDLAWLTGHWRGEGLGGQAEEMIAPPLGGQIIGVFRQTKSDGSLMFYEFYQFAEEDGSVKLRIKHFNPDFTGWESKDISVEFLLVAIEESTAYFDGLTFARSGDVLRAAVMVEGQGRIDFRFERAPNP